MSSFTWLGRALTPLRPGVDALTSSTVKAPSTITVTSPVFKESDSIPRLCTIDGQGRFPGIEWTGLPEATRSLVLLVEDADIPFAVPVTHLIVYDIAPSVSGIEPGAVGGYMPGRSAAGWACGRNFLGAVGWTPPAPPPGHGMHRYAFQIFALDEQPRFRFPPHRGRLLRQIRPYIVARGRIIGTYTKS